MIVKIPLSITIITKNEEDRILSAITAIKDIADEVIVIDSGSTDKTCEIALKAGAKVIYNKWSGYGQQKIFAQKQCKNDWILNIDADEEVSKELRKEIIEIFANKKHNKFYAFRIRIVNKFRFEKKPKKLAYFYNQLRLYNRKQASFKESSVHDSVVLNFPDKAKIKQLKNIVFHQSFRSYSHWIEKINSYSQMQAKDAIAKNKKPSNMKILLSPVFAFFKAYIVRRYFIYGTDGIVYSKLYAFSRFCKMIKIKEEYLKVNQGKSKEQSP
tara:strand:+ start:8642 stop:9451 length:810 start_codon:yes stop_codon:yes gene_type:complete